MKSVLTGGGDRNRAQSVATALRSDSVVTHIRPDLVPCKVQSLV